MIARRLAQAPELVEAGLAGEEGGPCEESEPDLVVIDSYKSLHDLTDQPLRTRTATYDLAVGMASWGATTLLVGEYVAADVAKLPEFAIAEASCGSGRRRTT